MTARREDDETDLREAFQALRREDAQAVPPFDATLAGASHRGRSRMLPALAALASAAALAGALLTARPPREPAASPPPSLGIEHWVAPTDFLLQTPGREVLASVPRIGGPASLALFQSLPAGSPVPRTRSVSP